MANNPSTSQIHSQPAHPLQAYANARILLFAHQLPGVFTSGRTGRYVFDAFVKALRQISAKDNGPGVDTGDFACEGYLTRGAHRPLASDHPWDWLASGQPWSTSGLRPIGEGVPVLQAPCLGVIWLGPLTELTPTGSLPSPSRGQLAAFVVNGFGGPYGAGGIGALSQPLLGERIQAALKPNQVAVVGGGESLALLAERYGTTTKALRELNPDLPQASSDCLPAGVWLLTPRPRATSAGSAS